MSGKPFRLTRETTSLFSDHPDYLQSVRAPFDQTHLPVKTKDLEAQTTRRVNPNNGDVEVEFVYPLDNNDNIEDGRIYLVDTFVFNSSEETLKDFQRDFKYNHQGDKSQWREWLSQYAQVPVSDQEAKEDKYPTKEKSSLGNATPFAMEIGRSYVREFSRETLLAMTKRHADYINEIIQAAHGQIEDLKVKLGDSGSHYSIIYRKDETIEITLTLVLDSDADASNGRLLVKNKFVLDAQSRKLKDYGRSWETASDDNEEYRIAAEQLMRDEVSDKTGKDQVIEDLIHSLLPMTREEFNETTGHLSTGKKEEFQARLDKVKDRQAETVKQQEAAQIEGLKILQFVGANILSRRYDETQGWVDKGIRFIARNDGINLKRETELWGSIHDKALAEIKDHKVETTNLFEIIESLDLTADEKALKDVLFEDVTLQQLNSILEEPSDRLRYENLRYFSKQDLMKREELQESAVAIAQVLQEKGSERVKQDASSILAYAAGNATAAVKLDYMLPKFGKQLLAPSALAGMVGAGVFGAAAEAMLLRSIGGGIGTLGRIGRLTASGAGLYGEAFSFKAIENIVSSAKLNTEKVWHGFGAETLAMSALFFSMRLTHGAVGKAATKLGNGEWLPELSVAASPKLTTQPTGRIILPAVTRELTTGGKALLGILNHGGGVAAMYGAGLFNRLIHLQEGSKQGELGNLFDTMITYPQAIWGFKIADGLTAGKLHASLGDYRSRLEGLRQEAVSDGSSAIKVPLLAQLFSKQVRVLSQRVTFLEGQKVSLEGQRDEAVRISEELRTQPSDSEPSENDRPTSIPPIITEVELTKLRTDLETALREKARIPVLELELKGKANVIRQMGEDLETAKKAAADADEKVTQLEADVTASTTSTAAEVQRLRSELDTARAEQSAANAKLKEQGKVFDQSLRDEMTAVEKAKGELAVERAKLGDAKRELGALRIAAEDNESQRAFLQTQLDTEKANVARQEAAVNQLKGKLLKNEEALKNLRGNLGQAERVLKEAQRKQAVAESVAERISLSRITEHKAAGTQVLRLETQLHEAQARVTEQKEKANTLEREVQTRRRLIEDYEKGSTDLKNRLEKVSVERDRQVGALTEKIEALVVVVEEKESETKKLQEALELKGKLAENLQRKMDTQQRTLVRREAEVEQQASRLTQKWDAEVRRGDAAEGERDALQISLGHQGTQLEQLRTELKSTQQILGAQGVKLSTRELELAETKLELEIAKGELRDLGIEKAEVDYKVTELAGELNQKKTELEERIAQLRANGRLLEEESQRGDTAEAEIKARRKEIIRLEECFKEEKGRARKFGKLYLEARRNLEAKEQTIIHQQKQIGNLQKIVGALRKAKFEAAHAANQIIDSLRSKVKVTEQQLKLASIHLQKLTEKVAGAKQEKAQAVAEVEKQVRQLKADFEQAKTNVTNEKKLIKHLRGELDKMRRDHHFKDELVIKRLGELEGQILEKEMEGKTGWDEFRILKGELKRIKTEWDNEKAATLDKTSLLDESLRKRKRSQGRAISFVRKMSSLLRSSRREKQRVETEAVQKIAALEQAIAVYKGDLKKATTRTELLHSAFQRAQEAHTQFEQSVAQFGHSAHAELRTKILEIEELIQRINLFERSGQAKDQEIIRLNGELEEKVAAVAERERQLGEEQKRASGVEDERDKFESDFYQARDEKLATAADLEAARIEIDRQKTEYDVKESEYQAALGRARDLDSHLQIITGERDAALRKFDEKNTEALRLQQQLAEVRGKLENQERESRKIIHSLETQLSVAQQEVARAHVEAGRLAEIETIKGERDTAQRNLDEKNVAVAQLQQRLSEAQSNIENHEEQAHKIINSLDAQLLTAREEATRAQGEESRLNELLPIIEQQLAVVQRDMGLAEGERDWARQTIIVMESEIEIEKLMLRIQWARAELGVPLGKEKYYNLGRRSDCDIVIKEQNVALTQSQIWFRDGVWRIRDIVESEDAFASSTIVNGKKVMDQQIELKDGDIIGFGTTNDFEPDKEYGDYDLSGMGETFLLFRTNPDGSETSLTNISDYDAHNLSFSTQYATSLIHLYGDSYKKYSVPFNRFLQRFPALTLVFNPNVLAKAKEDGSLQSVWNGINHYLESNMNPKKMGDKFVSQVRADLASIWANAKLQSDSTELPETQRAPSAAPLRASEVEEEPIPPAPPSGVVQLHYHGVTSERHAFVKERYSVALQALYGDASNEYSKAFSRLFQNVPAIESVFNPDSLSQARDLVSQVKLLKTAKVVLDGINPNLVNANFITKARADFDRIWASTKLQEGVNSPGKEPDASISKPRAFALATGMNYFLGRQLYPNDGSISTKHIEIIDTGSGWQIKDLGSRNGTFINNKKIEPIKPTVLMDGDVIQIGRQRINFHVYPDGNAVFAEPYEFFGEEKITLGTGEGCSARLYDPSVGADHLKIERSKNVWVLVDRGSPGGTRLGDGGKLPPKQWVPLLDKAIIHVGKIDLQFTIEKDGRGRLTQVFDLRLPNPPNPT